MAEPEAALWLGPYSPVPCCLSFVLRGLRLLPRNGRLYCVRWLYLARLGCKVAGAARRHAGWESTGGAGRRLYNPSFSWSICGICAAGRSQELYYITPDGKASEAQDTLSMPALLDSLQGPQVFRRHALASHLRSSRAARPHRNLRACAVRSERTSSAQFQLGNWCERMRQCLARVSQTSRLPLGLLLIASHPCVPCMNQIHMRCSHLLGCPVLQGGRSSCACESARAWSRRTCSAPAPASRFGASSLAASRVRSLICCRPFRCATFK